MRPISMSGLLPSALAIALGGCTIDPWADFSGASQTFNADYYYCHVEPELIVAKKCGPGDPALGDNSNCHFSPAVPGMALRDHPPIDCGGGDHPALGPMGLGATGSGSIAQADLTAVSAEMNTDYTMAALYVRPLGNNHPRAVLMASDTQVQTLLRTWASK